MYHILSMHSSVNRHLAFSIFCLLVDNVAMNVDVKVFVQVPCFQLLSTFPRSEYVGSYSNSKFSFLRNCQTVFLNGYTILHLHQKCMRVEKLNRCYLLARK